MSHETIKELIVDAPPVSMASLLLLGVPINTWIMILTFIYVLLRLVFFIYDRYVLHTSKRKTSDELEI